MKTIKEQADLYVGHPEEIGEDLVVAMVRETYIAGANFVLQELELAISGSKDAYLRENLARMIRQLKGKG